MRAREKRPRRCTPRNAVFLCTAVAFVFWALQTWRLHSGLTAGELRPPLPPINPPPPRPTEAPPTLSVALQAVVVDGPGLQADVVPVLERLAPASTASAGFTAALLSPIVLITAAGCTAVQAAYHADGTPVDFVIKESPLASPRTVRGVEVHNGDRAVVCISWDAALGSQRYLGHRNATFRHAFQLGVDVLSQRSGAGASASHYLFLSSSFAPTPGFAPALLHDVLHDPAAWWGCTFLRGGVVAHSGFNVEYSYRKDMLAVAQGVGIQGGAAAVFSGSAAKEASRRDLVHPLCSVLPLEVVAQRRYDDAVPHHVFPPLGERACTTMKARATMDVLVDAIELLLGATTRHPGACSPTKIPCDSVRIFAEQCRHVSEKLAAHIGAIPGCPAGTAAEAVALLNGTKEFVASGMPANFSNHTNEHALVQKMRTVVLKLFQKGLSYAEDAEQVLMHAPGRDTFAGLDIEYGWAYMGRQAVAGRVLRASAAQVEVASNMPVLHAHLSRDILVTVFDGVGKVELVSEHRGGVGEEFIQFRLKRHAELYEAHYNSHHPAKEIGVTLVWWAWCAGCCGFSNEIAGFTAALERKVPLFSNLAPSTCHCGGLSPSLEAALERSFIAYPDNFEIPAEDVYVAVSHTNPVGFTHAAGEMKALNNAQRSPDYFIGRSMYEFSAIPNAWVEEANKDAVDEIWVPSDFVRDAFAGSGVNPEKLVIIGEPIDTDYYDPAAVTAVEARRSNLLTRSDWRTYNSRPGADLSDKFMYLSSFKWEPRKGWDGLLEGYIEAFKHDNSVVLLISTYMYNKSVNDTRDPSLFQALIDAQCAKMGVPVAAMPHIIVLTSYLAEYEVRSLYAMADAFVLPTRGEGWGLPTIQAMSMGLPTITTAWGGNMAFTTPANSYLIRVEGVVNISEDAARFYDFNQAVLPQWAQIDVQHLQELLRYVRTHHTEAKAIGAFARRDISERFGLAPTAAAVMKRLEHARGVALGRRLAAQPAARRRRR